MLDRMLKGRSDKGAHPYLSRTAKNYHLHYERLWGERRHEVEYVLEVGSGPSALALAEYFPNATVVAFDQKELDISAPRIITVVGDQCYPIEVMRLGYEYDIIIDDASHIAAKSGATLLLLWPYLKEGGYYVIEDMHADPEYDELIDMYSHLGRPVVRTGSLAIWQKRST